MFLTQVLNELVLSKKRPAFAAWPSARRPRLDSMFCTDMTIQIAVPTAGFPTLRTSKWARGDGLLLTTVRLISDKVKTG